MPPEEARCWIFGSSLPLSAEDPRLRGPLERFFSQWQSHGESVAGRWRVLEERFLIVQRDPDGADVSGCSIDSMVGQVKELERGLGVRLLDSSRVFFRSGDGKVRSATRPEFKALVSAGEIGPDTEVFDTTLTRIADLAPGIFSKPLRDSWHAQLYEQALRKS
jgi:hypothetical protein